MTAKTPRIANPTTGTAILGFMARPRVSNQVALPTTSIGLSAAKATAASA